MNVKDFINEYYGRIARDDAETLGKEVGACYCGKDPSRCSLYVRRDRGSLVYVCHSVGCSVGSGRAASTPGQSCIDGAAGQGGAARKPEDRGAIALPESFTPGVPRGAGEWLKTYGVTEDDVKRYGIGYDTGRQRIVWPVREAGELLSWQARDWQGRSKLKWLTPKGVTTSPVFYSLGKPIKPDYCIIVEDVLSAMRVGKMYSSLALLGTSATPRKLSRIAAWYRESKAKQVVLLLDDDAPDKALKIITALTQRGIPAILRIGRLGKDPKEYTSEELIKIIEG